MTSSTNNLIARLEIVPIREAFRREASHFTTWLETQIEALSERIGIELTVIQREKAVGDFSVDLLCEDSNGKLVIIENQLEKTDHSHLGQLLTYLVNLGASTAIWIATEPRPEHKKVIDWLNEVTPADIAFYIVKVEAIRIKDSPFAPLFTVLASPDRQSKEIGEKKKELADRHIHRQEFWKGLLEKSKSRTSLFANIKPSTDSWISTGAGRSNIHFQYTISINDANISLYIDNDKETGEKNKAIFDLLYSQKAQIEEELGTSLEWNRLDNKRASIIRRRFGIGLKVDEDWPALQDTMIEAMIAFEKAIRPRLDKIKI